MVRKLLLKGPSFREQMNINWNRVESFCMDGVRKYRIRWANKEKVDVRVLADWEYEINAFIKERITYLKKKHVRWRKLQVLRTSKHLEYLNDFHKHYVLVPADKAGSNIIVVCKKYYLDVVLSELNMDRPTTYVATDMAYNDIVVNHIQDMVHWDILVPNEMMQLPTMYWLPKLHKNPYGSRFIAASNKCTTKPLSGILTACLSTVITHFKEYCNGIFRNTGVNCFWIINNSLHVINTLRNINISSKARSFDSFDFSTLYTSIPHDSLKYCLKMLIEEAYRVRGANYLTINRNRKCTWARSKGLHVNIDKDRLIEMIEYLVDNIYVHVGNRVFRQCMYWHTHGNRLCPIVS